jgi:hypothetical protein
MARSVLRPPSGKGTFQAYIKKESNLLFILVARPKS